MSGTMDVDMSDAGDAPESKVHHLLQPTSRWKTLPENAKLSPSESLGPRYNMLIYLKGLEEGQDWQQSLLDAANNSQKFSSDFELGQGGAVTEVVLRGNNEATTLMNEMDGLIELARMVWSSGPGDNLDDWIQARFEATYDRHLFESYPTKRRMLDKVLEWADRWAEVRYRFMNHYLRDDPAYADNIRNNWQRSGDEANSKVHASAIELDCELVNTRWFNPYQAFYQDVYGLTPKEGRRLLCIANWTALVTPIRNVYRWTIEFMNRVIDWRARTLRAVVQGAMNEARATRNRNWQPIHRTQAARVDDITSSYDEFLISVRAFIEETRKTQRLRASQWDVYMSRINKLVTKIRGNALNAATVTNFPRGNLGRDLFPERPVRPIAPHMRL